MSDTRTFIRNDYDTQTTAQVDAHVMTLAGTSSGGAALLLAQSAYALAAIGTNVGTNALNAAAAAQSTANGAYSVAVAGTNLAQAAYNLAAIGTNLGTNAYNIAVAGSSLAASKFTLPALTSGSVLFSNGVTIVEDNTHLFWNNSTKCLGVDKASPLARLHLGPGGGLDGPTPLRFSSATTVDFPAIGDVEFNGTWWFTDASGIPRRLPLKPGVDYQTPLVAADATHDGYLKKGDWSKFSNGYTIATSGTNLAQAAYNLAAVGTNVGTNALTIATAGSNLAFVAVPTIPGDRTYYVRTDGNDTNTGLANTAGGAFLTIQRAIDVASLYDIGNRIVVIQVADGTYNGPLEIGPMMAHPVHFGTTGWLIIRGNAATPANVSIVANSSTNTGHAICASMQSRVRLESFKVSATDAGIVNLVNAQLSSVVRIDNLVFGSLANATGVHIVAEGVAQVSIVGNYTIANGAYRHIQAMMGSTVWSSGGLTVTLTGTPAFTQFVRAETDSAVYLPTMTFVGAATGSKYSTYSNGVIDTGGQAEDFLPGSTPGTNATGGQYIGAGNTPATVISTNTTYYVRTDGSDANTGLFNTAAGAWLTIQHAVDFISGCVVLAGVTATVQVGDGTYNEAVVTRKNIGGGSTVLTGNTVTPANCIIQGGASAAISGGSQLPWTVSGFELRSTSNDCVTVSGSLNLGAGIRFGAAGLSHVRARLAGKVQITSSYAIVGAAQSHLTAQTAGTIFLTSGITVTISGTPAFSVAFVSAASESTIQVPSITFSGSATGVRYLVASNAIIDAGGGIFSYLPGDTSGSATTGGQYLGTGATPVGSVSAAITYYVDTTNGLDTNDGLAAGAGRALKTIQAAINIITSQFIAAGVVVTVSIADGTYNEAVTLRPITGGGTVTVQGNTGTPTNVIVQGGAGTAFTVSGGTVGYTLTGMEIRSTSAQGIGVTGSESALTIGAAIVFGACATNHIRVINNSIISLTASYTISGAAAIHYSIDRGGRVSVTPSITITISGTPNFSTAFVVAATLGSVTIKSVTFSGSATGTRYTGTTLALIDTASGSGTYLPGNAAGSVATSAVYT